MEVHYTHTGKIYCDRERRLEFLTVGDYGKENNIKADFLGYTKKIEGVENRSVDLMKKWVATISTQRGCPMKCAFCDVHKYGFYGNVYWPDLLFQIRTIIEGENVHRTERFNVHFARMGEPTFNDDVLYFTGNVLDDVVEASGLHADVIHPVISTMLPKMSGRRLFSFLMDWCDIKRERNGEAGLQFSINSTDDAQRGEQFCEMSLSLKEIAAIGTLLPEPIGRKYTLNFAVTEKTILDPIRLTQLFDPKKFIVKLTPIHKTRAALENGFDVTNSYDSYDVYEKFEKPLVDMGWDVIVFVPSLEEDADRITCGNALIATENR